MKIADLSKKVNLSPQELRQKISAYGFDIGRKARTIKDETALDIISKVEAENKFVQSGETTEKEIEKESTQGKTQESSAESNVVEIPDVLTVKEFAVKLNLPVTEVIRELVKNGVMASINENIDFETAMIIGEDLGFEIKKAKEEQEEFKPIEVDKGSIKPRPPVIAVVGHIDHGKTSLIDNIRKSSIIAGESGGITQHIGAYQIEIKKDKKKRKITILDTPGHEAFVAMREHGARIADIAILIVAADEGVMPQTREAFNHTKLTGVPIIVAITKIDKPAADIEKVKNQLSDLGLVAEDWGGTTIVAPVSSKTSKGIKELIDMILLVSDMEKIKASYSGQAQGVVIESHLNAQKGPVASILVQSGILKATNAIIAGEVLGKIRMMDDSFGKKVEEAKPSDPVRIYGLNSVPNFGDRVYSFSNEKEAKNYLANIKKKESVKSLVKTISGQNLQAGQKLNVIIKADVSGSLKAIIDAIKNIKAEEGEINIISAGVGSISESDIITAEASNAVIFGFRVLPTSGTKESAIQKKIKIYPYQVIYDLIDQAKKLLIEEIGLIALKSEIGRAKVLAIFRKDKTIKIIGVKVFEGKIVDNSQVEIFRNDELLGHGKITSLKIQQQNVKEVNPENECGLAIETDADIEKDDLVRVFKIEEKQVEIK